MLLARRYKFWRLPLPTALLLLGSAGLAAQIGQLSPGRIAAMPNLPQPYEMRDWKRVARGADSLMFDKTATGEYLPLVRFRRPYNGRRLTDSIFGVPSYVGDQRGEGLEGILTLPSVVSGLLVGVDKRDQQGVDYVAASQDWYSRRDNENVYLNLPLTSTGSDWWYETMPNVFFHHIYDLAGPYGDAELHFTRVGEQWRRVVTALGGSATPWRAGDFNYRSFRIRDLTPVAGGVPEPEAAGAIAYLLDNTYRKTGDVRYRYAAEQSLDYLNGLTSNPRYELQLYYGVLAAARMNATERTSYDLGKMLGWSLSQGPLRRWGVSVTSAGGYDLHGLVGESERGNDYVFYMNGAQAVAALAPVARYDTRFARAIGKYILNVANNSRLFFSNYLPAENQDSYEWARENDPNGYLAYEAIRERLNGQSPFATGDAIRLGWAPTNIGLYGSAHTGYLGAVVDTTNVEGVLELNLNATDFLGPPSYPTRLYYNPYDRAVSVTARRPADVADGNADVYEPIFSRFIARDLPGDYTITIPADEAVILTWTPTGGAFKGDTEARVNDIAIDYFTSLGPREGRSRVKAAAFAVDSVAKGDTIQLHVTTRFAGDTPDWSITNIDDLPLEVVRFRRLDPERAIFTLRAGDRLGSYELRVRVQLENIPQLPDTMSVTLRVVNTVSGVRDLLDARAIECFPNPTSGVLSLKLPKGGYALTVSNAVGQTVLAGEYTADASGIELELLHVTNGLLFVQAIHHSTGARYTARVILHH